MINWHHTLHSLDFFEHKTKGLFCLLEDECKLPKPSNERFLETVLNVCKEHQAFVLPKRSFQKSTSKTPSTVYEFVIRHFSRDVTYSAVSKSNLLFFHLLIICLFIFS